MATIAMTVPRSNSDHTNE